MQRPQSSARERSTSLPLPPVSKLRRPSQEILESALDTISAQKREEPEKEPENPKVVSSPPRTRTGRRPSLAEQFNFINEVSKVREFG